MGKTASLANIGSIADSSLGFRNRIQNGDMRIDQRNAGASVTPTSTGSSTFLLDRWKADISQASKFSVQQSSTAPTGFTNSMVVTSLSAYAVGAAEVFAITQIIEGYNIADFGWGAAGASSVTLSFWVRSSLTGTFGIVLENSANNRSYPATYTISAANTWEQKSITIAGDTSGTWVTNSGKGVQIKFGLGVGSTLSGTAGAWAAADYWGATGATSVVGTNGATFYITGVQLEKGTQATSFDFRDYGRELYLCQRYYFQSTFDNNNAPISTSAYWTTSTAIELIVIFPQEMRSAPSISVPTVGSLYALQILTAWRQLSSISPNEVSNYGTKMSGNAATNTAFATAGQGTVIGIRSTGSINYSAEL